MIMIKTLVQKEEAVRKSFQLLCIELRPDVSWNVSLKL